jgi:hypothetical protein
MARTFRRRSPGLIQAIERNNANDNTVQAFRSPEYISRFGRHDAAILRGQDGAIKMDKCQDANIDNDGGFKLNGHDWTYFKNNTREVRRKRREAGKNQIRNALRD